MANKPSERFCKHGFLVSTENYNPDLHNMGETAEERCRDFYTQEEMDRMKTEIRVAECPLCMGPLTDINDCIVCSDGHKFHNSCLNGYWTHTPARQNFCPVSNTIPSSSWQLCSSINDINTGGKRKTSNKKRKSFKKSNKKRKSFKKSFKKSKKRV